MNNKAIIAMSGGVDSSVAAFLMKERGFDCIGVTMKLYNNEDIGIPRENTCCSLDDINDAKSVSFKLDMPFYIFDFSDEFKSKVIDKFISSYANGQTPNPCIDCNRYMKFEKLYNRAKETGFDYVVTGHYARIQYNGDSGRYLLIKAVDESKDQSYVLYSMTQEQLKHTVFPLGELRKSETRKIAEENGFRNYRKPDSQDICFVPGGNYADFIENYTGTRFQPGYFVDTEGNILGKHKGTFRYTIGQRKGLGISSKAPLYVSSINIKDNTVTLSDEKELYSKSLDAYRINLIAYEKLDKPVRVKAKIRYRQKEQWATVWQTDTDILHVEFDEPQRAITSGQAVVLYDDDTVVGGGTII